VPNGADNAPSDPNPDQEDLDQDGIGDVVDPVVLPLSKSDCMNAGHTRFHDGAARFKNQGECVSYVASGGKRHPSAN
jgi:hypothetical protein